MQRVIGLISAMCAVGALTLVAGTSTAGCGAKNVPTVVGQSGLAVAQSIGQIQDAVKQLAVAKAITTEQAIVVQEKLLQVNERIKPLPDLLRTIDRLQQAGSSTTEPVDRAIAILTVVGQDISVTIAGVPVAQATQPLIDLIRAAQQVVMTTLAEVARARGGE